MGEPSPNPRIVVRLGGVQDRARVTSIGFSAMRSFGIEPDPLDIDRDLATFGDGAAHKIAELVAEIGGEVVGSILSSTEDATAAKIAGFYVAEEARGTGVGARLLAEAIKACRRRGAHQINLTTHARMQSAMRLYEKFGFSRTGILQQTLSFSYGISRAEHDVLETNPVCSRASSAKLGRYAVKVIFRVLTEGELILDVLGGDSVAA